MVPHFVRDHVGLREVARGLEPVAQLPIELEIDRLSKEVERSRKLLDNERFVTNAAPEVVDAEREKLERYERELQALEATLT